jgi:hypothetical protein
VKVKSLLGQQAERLGVSFWLDFISSDLALRLGGHRESVRLNKVHSLGSNDIEANQL